MSTLWIPCSIILLVAIEEKHNWNQEMQLIATYLYINKEHMCRIVDMYMHLYAYIYIYVQAQQHSQLNINHDHIYIYIYSHILTFDWNISMYTIYGSNNGYGSLRGDPGEFARRSHANDRGYGSRAWIACVGPYILSCSHIYIYIYNVGPPSYKLVYKPH